MQTIYQSWFDQGMVDYYIGKVLDDNPSNILGSDQYNGWRDGWVRAHTNKKIWNKLINHQDENMF